MILLYHLVFPDSTPKGTWNAGKVLRLADFERQVNWLDRHYSILSLEEYLARYSAVPEDGQRSIAITFDDGYRRTFDLVSPFLIGNGIPATFFASTAHLEGEGLLWFVYFNALCFEGAYKSLKIEGEIFLLDSEKGCTLAWRRLINLARESGDAIDYSRRYAEGYPLPEPLIQNYLGLSEEQLSSFRDAAKLELGAHTHRHPYLDQISAQVQLAEMQKNKAILEDLSGQPVRYFAYTGGVYDQRSVEIAKQAGFEAAFAIQPRNLGDDPLFEMPRTDIYSPSLLKLWGKVSGAYELVGRLGLRKGEM